MKEYSEKECIMSQPKKMLISSFHLKNGTIITPLLICYLILDLQCLKTHQLVRYTPRNCFNSFVPSAVNARRQGDENPNSSVMAETMKLLANSSYGYQIMDRSASSQAMDSIKELWKTVEMDSCQSIAKCLERQSTLLQPTEDFEQ